jgi:hypothetical protein
MTTARTFWGVALFLVVAATGCSVTVTPPATGPTCSPDSTVTGCTGGASGFSCTGADTPDQSNASLICSDGVASGGDIVYCCVEFASTVTTTCAADSTVSGCTGASIGFSCTGTDTPEQADSSLNCSAGVAGNAGSTLFCCLPTSGATTCAADSTVAGCVGGALGYSCTGTDTPDQTNSALYCSNGVAGNAGSTLFCCVTFATTTSCAADGNVQGCAAGSIGFSCSGGDTPEIGDPSLTCSVGVAGSGATAGDTIYCCATATTASADTCAADATVQCANGAAGYACKGAAVPDTTSLFCSEPTLTATGANFCCLQSGTGVLTCSQDQAVVCPTPGSYGFSCDSTTTPAMEHAGLTCSAGVASGRTTQYCCQ